jgi:hypothetical protein
MNRWFSILTKADLLEILQRYVPQTMWPPRPTRQSDATIREIVRQASFNGFYGEQVRDAIGKRIAEKKRVRS